MSDKTNINEKELEKVNGGFDSPTLPEREDRNNRPGISEGAGWTADIPEFSDNKPVTYKVYVAVPDFENRDE